ncbi:hypothetical protein FRC07_011891 [Ceratobasidium sp. 392]|nr:hypothetical protein FRC07_011891 [Ceratobasidium sp. 392]
MSIFSDIPAAYYAVAFALGLIGYFVVPYLLDPHNLRRSTIQGPRLAALSNVWLAYIAARGDRSGEVHKLHQKYGKLVRIAPNHISVADPKALEVIYAHGNGALKSDFYDAFVSIQPGIFSTRDRAAHTRKRKLVSNIFSQQNVLLFEPHVRRHIRAFCAQWDMRCARASSGESPDARDGKSRFDVLPHFNYLAFDIIGDLAFGAPFGMIAAQKDVAPMLEQATAGEKPEMKYVPAVQVLNNRGDYSASVAVLPRWIRSWMNSSCAITYYLAANPSVQHKLQAELDNVLPSVRSPHPSTNQAGSPPLPPASVAAKFADIKTVPYLQACINEGLRLHSTSGLGLPRVIPKGMTLQVCGETFDEGTILSVPTYSLHHNKEAWGEDFEKYRPERWLEREVGREFNPFSFGPRYEFELVESMQKLHTREGFLRKPSEDTEDFEAYNALCQ